jgi:hypothetical protein
MKRIQIAALIIAFPLIAVGLALFLTMTMNASSYTFAVHSLRLSLPQFFALFLGSLVLLVLSWLFIAKVEKNFFPDKSLSLLWENFFA